MNVSEPRASSDVVRTTCPYCGVGCGVLARPVGDGRLDISGDPDHPANFGRLCSKGSALGETVSLEGRLLYPMMRTKRGGYARVSWEAALDATAEGFGRIRARRGGDAIAFYLSGQLLTEDYYVANKLMKGFLGSAHVDTNSRLCMASSVAGHRRAFGADVVPGSYDDFDSADCIVLVGSNAAWCHPVLFQRMLRNRVERGAKLVAIDPRRSTTAEDADLFLAVKPGMDSVLFAGLLTHLADVGAFDARFIEQHTVGLPDALDNARQLAPSLARVAALTGLRESDVLAFYDLWRKSERVVTSWSQGVNQSAQGVDKVNAIINCHLATGRIGRAGMGPFSLTGQPNAMGGREVGGLANMLAAHMDFAPAEIERVKRFWRAPDMADREGLKAVAMMDAAAEGRIGALWVIATNPAASLPRADHARMALQRLDHFVVSDVVLSNDTIASGAHILLPSAAWSEKDGAVTNSERRISRQRQVLSLPGEARPDWWIISETAKRLGFPESFDYPNAAAIFREHAALSAFENDGRRTFDIGALANLSDSELDALTPIQWPRRKGATRDETRLFAQGGFPTADGKARFVALAPPRLAQRTSRAFPLLLNTGRVRDQWHTMTRTGRSPRLGLHRSEPFVAIHPADAARYALRDGGLARVTTADGEATLRVAIDDGLRVGEIFAPIHWTAETSSHGRIGALAQSAVDPISGQPEMKATPARVAPFATEVDGFLLSRDPIALPSGLWWSRAAIESGYAYLLASADPLAPTLDAIRANLPAGEVVEYTDPSRAVARIGIFDDEHVTAALFLGDAPHGPHWNAARAFFNQAEPGDDTRRSALSGIAGCGAAVDGPIICACFGVGVSAISAAIASGLATDVASIGVHLKAGGNCGSCVPELRKLLAVKTAAEACANIA